ncbi:hypothetical protein NFI95_06715 [Acetobacteraceae bacterium KSS8]|uniref:Uncharacterized protein n=1 Tax=Endosaccharibacter trunci TaxID=2812733 RepID=A0ABT1W5K8_9PROT|nr:hypothetical protein [Acetobacteraceae bacterium KSS8]
MQDPNQPSKLPSLMPFVVIAAVLVLIFVGVSLFPVFKRYMVQQDCIASGQTSCVQPH